MPPKQQSAATKTAGKKCRRLIQNFTPPQRRPDIRATLWWPLQVWLNDVSQKPGRSRIHGRDAPPLVQSTRFVALRRARPDGRRVRAAPRRVPAPVAGRRLQVGDAAVAPPSTRRLVRRARRNRAQLRRAGRPRRRRSAAHRREGAALAAVGRRDGRLRARQRDRLRRAHGRRGALPRLWRGRGHARAGRAADGVHERHARALAGPDDGGRHGRFGRYARPHDAALAGRAAHRRRGAARGDGGDDRILRHGAAHAGPALEVAALHDSRAPRFRRADRARDRRRDRRRPRAVGAAAARAGRFRRVHHGLLRRDAARHDRPYAGRRGRVRGVDGVRARRQRADAGDGRGAARLSRDLFRLAADSLGGRDGGVRRPRAQGPLRVPAPGPRLATRAAVPEHRHVRRRLACW